MKTVTTILIIFLIAALTIFAVSAGKAMTGPREEDESSTIEEIPEIQVEEEIETEIEEDPGAPQQVEEEEPDPETITSIEIYLDGPKDEGIFPWTS